MSEDRLNTVSEDRLNTVSEDRLRIGVSSCLLGNSVRYDGGHKRDRFLTDVLATLADFVPVCPEFEMGLGAPRETLRVVRGDDGERLVAPGSGSDHTRRHDAWAQERLRALEALDLDGFVLKSKSPSCGLERVPVYTPAGAPIGKVGTGMFTARLQDHQPWMPLEEEGRLRDARLRECFFERVLGYRRLRTFFRGSWQQRDLVDLHRREKLLLLAHSPDGARQLGALVAHAQEQPRDEVASQYTRRFLQILARVPTRGRHVNALQHAAGFLKTQLGAAAKAEFAEVVESYRRRQLPLEVPLTLLRHHVRERDVDWLADQTYLVGHPREFLSGVSL